MSVEQRNSAVLESKEAFQAMGVMWKGTFESAFAGTRSVPSLYAKCEHKKYPMSQNPYDRDPGFTFMIPITVDKNESK